MSGVYRESLEISTPLTIVGQTTGVDQEKQFICSLSNDQASPIQIDCPGGKVVIRGMAINGEGHRTKQEFNAVDLRGGTLVMEDCELRTSSFNCIKVRGDAALGVRNCQFLDSREFAISTKDHQTVQAVGCTFLRSGVQLVGGTGRIERCQFFGNHGCYVSHSLQKVEIIDCTFEQCQDYGIASASGGDVSVKNTELLDCELALNVQTGALAAGQGSRIEGGRMAAGVTSGTLNLTDVSISDLDNGIVVTEDAEVTLKQLFIKGCRDTAIIMQSGRLDFQGGSVHDCGVGAMLGDETRWQEVSVTSTVESVDFKRCASYAIAIYSGPTRLSDLEISECMYGLYVHGPAKVTGGAESRGDARQTQGKDESGADHSDSLASVVQVSAENIRFTEVEKAAILARGDCTVRHKDLQIDPKSKSKGAVAVGGARVIAGNP
jgi:hypothetical protein